MKSITQQLTNKFADLLKNLVGFTSKEIEAFSFLLSCLVVDPRFSLVRVSKASGGRFSRKMLANLLIKFVSVQDKVLQTLCEEVVSLLGRRSRFFMSVDDQLVRKCGKKIYGVLQWADHNLRRKVRAMCLVDVALVVKGQALFIIPYLLLKTKMSSSKASKKRSEVVEEQDAKTLAAIELVTKVVGWLEAMKVRRKKIGLLADAWYSKQTFMTFVREMKLIYRIAGKKNYGVYEPDWKRIQRRKTGGRGRRPKHYVKTRRLDQYFETAKTRGSFLDPKTGKRVRWKSAIVTLKTAGRVRVYAFWREDCKGPIFILTPAVYQATIQPETVYQDYSWRWRVEECHRDLKQQFGLEKLRNREKMTVTGFLGLVYSYYSLFLLTRLKILQASQEHITAPKFQDETINTLYVEQGVVFI